MKKLLMCYPDYFDVTYDINPWMSRNQRQVDTKLAEYQWQKLFQKLSYFVDTELINGVKGLPDLVFTANAGFVIDNNVVLSKFAKQPRQGEEIHFKSWFLNHGYNVVHTQHFYEGAGDHLVDSQNRHWVACGFRTNYNTTNEIKNFILGQVNQVKLIDPRWYHLDTAFCPLNDDKILWYPGAFDQKSQYLIRNSFNSSFEVKESDALEFCCNTVIIDNNVFMPKNANVNALLTSLGYRVFEFDLSEFMKSGGAAKCLTLEI